jgi:hypothetical protein
MQAALDDPISEGATKKLEIDHNRGIIDASIRGFSAP